jgi:hypothetical protein
MSNNYGEEQFQTLLPFERKMKINNLLPLDMYNESLNKYIFFASGKSIKHWRFFKCTFENIEFKYKEVEDESNQLTISTYYEKYQFLYNVDDEFCCVVRIINNFFEILLY